MNECKSLADGQFSTAKVQNPRWSSIEIQNVLCYWVIENRDVSTPYNCCRIRNNETNSTSTTESILFLTKKTKRATIGCGNPIFLTPLGPQYPHKFPWHPLANSFLDKYANTVLRGLLICDWHSPEWQSRPHRPTRPDMDMGERLQVATSKSEIVPCC